MIGPYIAIAKKISIRFAVSPIVIKKPNGGRYVPGIKSTTPSDSLSVCARLSGFPIVCNTSAAGVPGTPSVSPSFYTITCQDLYYFDEAFPCLATCMASPLYLHDLNL